MRISDWSSDVCSSDLLRRDSIEGAKGFARVNLARMLDLAQSSLHIARMLIETEATPNPATVKFIPGRVVMGMGTRDFATPEEAEASPLADALFGLGDVTGVFFGGDFISVTIAPGAQWSDRSEEHTSELQSLMRHSYAVYCLRKK